MKNLLLLGAALLLLQATSSAKVLRVGYPGIPLSGTDFSDLQSAVNAAGVGDTIHLYPGTWGANFNKKLVVIGKGYFTEGTGANTGLETLQGVAYVTAWMYAGSDSSTFWGLGDGAVGPYYNQVVNAVKIRRCQLSVVRFNDQTCNGWEISQCVIANLTYNWGGGLVTNLNVSNSFLQSVTLQGMAASGLSGLFANNIFSNNGANYFQNGGFIFQSNIFIGSSTNFQSAGNCFFQNNLAEGTSLLPAGNGNVNGVAMANVFVGYPTQGSLSNDARFQLKSGSPAIGAGYNGADAGMFGGTNPYRLSGIPPMPAIFKLTAPGTVTTSNPYTITVSARSNN